MEKKKGEETSPASSEAKETVFISLALTEVKCRKGRGYREMNSQPLDRFFPNELPSFMEERDGDDDETVTVGSVDSLSRLLSSPYSLVSQKLKRAALDLKQTIVVKTWGLTRQRVRDYTLYAGTLGTAFLALKAYQVTNNRNDLNLCAEIVKACDCASSHSRDVTFICGRAGICSLGAVAAKHLGDHELMSYYVANFKQIKLPSNLPDELLYGRAGFLWACLYLNKNVGEETISHDYMVGIVKEILKSGRKLGARSSCPLMFEWYGEKYWGAAHGLAGIMYVLMHMKLNTDKSEEVKRTLNYMIKNQFRSGNYPASEKDRKRDCILHWCHGAPGVALTLVKAAEVFGEGEFLQAAIKAAEVVWNRGLLKKVGICHGVSGNTYVFLSLYRLTGNQEFLYKAKAFSCFLLERAHELIGAGIMHGGDNPYSLFEGMGGMAYLFLDMVDPFESRFPGYEL